MSDPTQFIVAFSVAHRLLKHEGILGTGKDLITNSTCSLHSYTDKFKRTYIMQLFDSVQADFISNKLNSMSKFAHSSFISNIIRPAFMSTRKTQKSFYELSIFYDFTGIGELTLDELIDVKRQHGQKFQAVQITAFFWQIADFLMLCIRNSSEYLDLNPHNIYCKIDGFYGYNFFISNLNKKTAKQSKKWYHNPKDRFYNNNKTCQTSLSAAMFTFGMILLQLSSLMPSKDLYENGQINQKALQKRIEGITITNERMISTMIKSLLQVNQAKRLKPTDIFKGDEWLKLRKVAYYQSKPDFFAYKNFQGIIEYDKKTSIGQALDANLCMLRGTFTNGIFEGRGVKEVKDTLEMGIFLNGQLIEGQCTKKNNYIDIGKFKSGSIIQGMRIYLNISNLHKQNNKSLQGFIGQFAQNEPKQGRYIFSDGNQQAK